MPHRRRSDRDTARGVRYTPAVEARGVLTPDRHVAGFFCARRLPALCIVETSLIPLPSLAAATGHARNPPGKFRLDGRAVVMYTHVYVNLGRRRRSSFSANQPTGGRADTMSDYAKENLSRLMAGEGISIQQVAERTGLDERTIRGILNGTNKPHAKSLHRLAEGLGVKVDELFLSPTQLLYRQFDRKTNPMVEEVLQANPELFVGWRETDFDELHSRMGAGGALTREGTLAAVDQMNRKRELHEKLDLLLESSQAKLVGGMIDLAYEQIIVE